MPSFNLRKKNGRYYADIYDPDRSPPRLTRTLRTTDRRTAKRKLQRFERDVAADERDPWSSGAVDKHITFAEAVRRYQKEKASVDRPASRKTKASRYRNFRRLLPNDILLSGVTDAHVRDFLTQLSGRNGNGAAEATKEGYFGSLYGLFTWCVEEGYLEKHPLAKMQGPKASGDTFHILSPTELQLILDVIDADTHPYLPGKTIEGTRRLNRLRVRRYLLGVIDLAISSGVRISELCGLQWKNVRLRRGTATIRVQSYHGARTKTEAAQRTIPVYPRGVLALKELRDAYRREHDRKPPASRIVFRSAWDKPLLDQTIQSLYAEYVGKSGIGFRTTFHDLRHTYISWQVNELGLPLPIVQELAGHANIGRTRSYARVSHATILENIGRTFRMAGIESAYNKYDKIHDSGYAEIARFMAAENEYARLTQNLVHT